MTKNPPHYVIVGQGLGPMDADFTVRIGADNAAHAACQEWGRRAKLPAHEAECAGYHLFFPAVCLAYQYTYECIVKDEDGPQISN